MSKKGGCDKVNTDERERKGSYDRRKCFGGKTGRRESFPAVFFQKASFVKREKGKKGKMQDNLIVRTTAFAAHVVSAYLKEGDRAVDATCGNGKDTLFLCGRVGKTGLVYAFDIQKQALEKARRTLETAGETAKVKWILDSHQNLLDYVQAREVQAVLFNLGYLPGGDKQVTTRKESTLEGARAALEALKRGGILSLVMYPGYPQGSLERLALLEMARSLDPKRFHCQHVSPVNQGEGKILPPEVLFITKKI